MKENNLNLRNSVLDEDQIEQPKFGLNNNKIYQGNNIPSSNNPNLMYSNNTLSMKIPNYSQNIDYSDELTKSNNLYYNRLEFLKK